MMSSLSTSDAFAGSTRAMRSLPSVQSVVVWLVAGCLLPCLLGGLFVTHREYQLGRELLQERAVQTARALLQTVDAQLGQAQLLALSLAEAGSLANLDFAEFHRRSKALIDQTRFAQSILVFDASGQQLVNTRLTLGQALPKTANPAQIQQVFSSGKPVLSDVFLSATDGQPVISVAAPVMRNGKVAYAVSVSLSPEVFTAVLNKQQLPADWVATVLDNVGVHAGHSTLAAERESLKALPKVWEPMQGQPEGIVQATTHDGIHWVSAFSRSARTGWSVVIGIPKGSFEATVMNGLLWILGVIVVVISVILGILQFWGGRIVQSVSALQSLTAALGRGEAPTERPLVFRESQQVAQALIESATQLQTRNHEMARAHHAMAQRELELQNAQRIAGIGSWSWDLATDVTESSATLCAVFGLSEIPDFAQQSGVMFAPEVWQQLRQARLAMAHTGVGYSLELPALRADGTPIWVDMRCELVRDASDKVTGLRGTVQDITERKQSQSVATSERFIRAITDHLPELIAYWDTDLRCKFVNQSFLRYWDMTPSQMAGIHLDELMGESLFAISKARIQAALGGEEQQFERFLTKPDESLGHVLVRYLPDRDEHGQVRGFITLVSDIRAQKLAEGALTLAATVYEHMTDAVMVTDRDGVIQSVNPAFTRLTAFPAEEAIGKTPALMHSDLHTTEFYAQRAHKITTTGFWEGEVWSQRKGGGVFLMAQNTTRIGTAGDEAERFVSVLHDITVAWKKTEDHRQRAFHDALTGLPNRALLVERLERQIISAQRVPRPIAVLFLDLDGFKQVNDTLGHGAGDFVLETIADKLTGLVRQTDTVARLGGDEFVITLDNPSSPQDVVLITHRIITLINEPMALDGQPVHVGASVGIALFPDHASNATGLLQAADSAMYRAKRAGKNQSYIFTATPTTAPVPLL